MAVLRRVLRAALAFDLETTHHAIEALARSPTPAFAFARMTAAAFAA